MYICRTYVYVWNKYICGSDNMQWVCPYFYFTETQHICTYGKVHFKYIHVCMEYVHFWVIQYVLDMSIFLFHRNAERMYIQKCTGYVHISISSKRRTYVHTETYILSKYLYAKEAMMKSICST